MLDCPKLFSHRADVRGRRDMIASHISQQADVRTTAKTCVPHLTAEGEKISREAYTSHLRSTRCMKGLGKSRMSKRTQGGCGRGLVDAAPTPKGPAPVAWKPAGGRSGARSGVGGTVTTGTGMAAERNGAETAARACSSGGLAARQARVELAHAGKGHLGKRHGSRPRRGGSLSDRQSPDRPNSPVSRRNRWSRRRPYRAAGPTLKRRAVVARAALHAPSTRRAQGATMCRNRQATAAAVAGRSRCAAIDVQRSPPSVRPPEGSGTAAAGAGTGWPQSQRPPVAAGRCPQPGHTRAQAPAWGRQHRRGNTGVRSGPASLQARAKAPDPQVTIKALGRTRGQLIQHGGEAIALASVSAVGRDEGASAGAAADPVHRSEVGPQGSLPCAASARDHAPATVSPDRRLSPANQHER